MNTISKEPERHEIEALLMPVTNLLFVFPWSVFRVVPRRAADSGLNFVNVQAFRRSDCTQLPP
jgi:hypothetical protein